MDFGCSYHMFPYRGWFGTYKPYYGGTVLKGNSSACNTIGIKIIKIKMFNGMVRTLGDVRHVPDLKKNYFH